MPYLTWYNEVLKFKYTLKDLEKYYGILMEHRGIVEMDGKNKQMKFENPDKWGTQWLTIDKTNYATYSWLFAKTSADMGVAYFVVDLKELAALGGF
jgi:hypothetical protein